MLKKIRLSFHSSIGLLSFFALGICLGAFAEPQRHQNPGSEPLESRIRNIFYKPSPKLFTCPDLLGTDRILVTRSRNIRDIWLLSVARFLNGQTSLFYDLLQPRRSVQDEYRADCFTAFLRTDAQRANIEKTVLEEILAMNFNNAIKGLTANSEERYLNPDLPG